MEMQGEVEQYPGWDNSNLFFGMFWGRTNVYREIVWYGSMNFLAKEDAEDNLILVCSKDIASELLELAFGKTEMDEKHY